MTNYNFCTTLSVELKVRKCFALRFILKYRQTIGASISSKKKFVRVESEDISLGYAMAIGS